MKIVDTDKPYNVNSENTNYAHISLPQRSMKTAFKRKFPKKIQKWSIVFAHICFPYLFHPIYYCKKKYDTLLAYAPGLLDF